MKNSKKQSIGRPPSTSFTIRMRLYDFDWLMHPINDYEGMGRSYIVTCMKCGKDSSKWLGNIFYRGDKCYRCESTEEPIIKQLDTQSQCESQNNIRTMECRPADIEVPNWEKAISAGAVKPVPPVPPVDITKVLEDIVEKTIRPLTEELASQRQLLLTLAGNKQDIVNEFGKAFKATVARHGYVCYDRKLDPKEWEATSHGIAKELIDRVDVHRETTLYRNYEHLYNRGIAVPAHTILMKLLSKEQLIESVHILNIMRVSR